mmetsp:Transcript_62824/g.147363  ORF Transcript_62824/g.147363 Transcript_62824/m.147363 type:complete len:552 (+) Transcript_62824:13-1668(+)
MQQKAWLREFNLLGYCLRPQAAKLIASFLETCSDPERAVEGLILRTKARLHELADGAFVPVIDEELVKTVVADLVEAPEGVREEADEGFCSEEVEEVHVFNALTQVKPFAFNDASKVWEAAKREPSLFPPVDSKGRIYQDRYHLLYQRLLLNLKEDGQPALVPESKALAGLFPGQRVLTTVASLVGNPGRKLTFGLLRKIDDELRGRWVIEDLHKVLPVEMAVQTSDHFVTDASFILAEGEVVSGTFQIHELCAVEAIPRKVTLQTDEVPRQAFGGTMTGDQLLKLEKQIEPAYSDGMFVVLSEVHLDSVQVLDMLEILFQGYENAGPPAAYVFMGNFCSSAFVPTADGVRSYREGFDRLKLMLRGLEAHVMRGTRFIFIPGPKDPGAQTLPRAPLPNYLTADLAKDIPGVVMATNPCRVRHFSREMVYFRHDVLRLLRRHEAVPLRSPPESQAQGFDDQRYTQAARFILDQAHLVPLPLEESNILWEYDHTLRLYPLPHAVFIGGSTPPFECNYKECKFTSVGPFSAASFYAYYPVKEELEVCDVPDRAG